MMPTEGIHSPIGEALGGGKQDRFLIESLGVEEQTSHIEDDGCGSATERSDWV
jgi:hypothetical protein